MLVAISAMHLRTALSRVWGKHTKTLGFDHVVVAIASEFEEDENVRLCTRLNFTVVLTPNTPLSGKFNAAMKSALAMGATRVMILGSDDFVSPAWMKEARDNQADYLIPHACGIVDLATRQAYAINKLSFGTMKFGAGRVIRRESLACIGADLWPPEIDKGLDGASHQRLLRAGVRHTIVRTEGIPVTDVKTPENIWPFSSWRASGIPCRVEDALHMLSPASLTAMYAIPVKFPR